MEKLGFLSQIDVNSIATKEARLIKGPKILILETCPVSFLD